MKKNKKDIKRLNEENAAARKLARENLKNIDKPRKPINQSFKAKFDGGQCPKCLLEIKAGETVRYNNEDELIHATHKKKEETYKVCNVCFLALPCMCEDY